jgi:hypothetical protein
VLAFFDQLPDPESSRFALVTGFSRPNNEHPDDSRSDPHEDNGKSSFAAQFHSGFGALPLRFSLPMFNGI